MHELLEHSLQHKKTQVTSLARKLIILITTDNIKATHELNEMIMKQVALSLESKAANVISVCEYFVYFQAFLVSFCIFFKLVLALAFRNMLLFS